MLTAMPGCRPHQGNPMSAGCDRGMGGACAVRRFAIVGGGFAGCAVAWHLLAAARSGAPIAVALFDGAGLGGGASGAAAGLLHPFTPRGRVRRRPMPGGQACSCCR